MTKKSPPELPSVQRTLPVETLVSSTRVAMKPSCVSSQPLKSGTDQSSSLRGSFGMTWGG